MDYYHQHQKPKMCTQHNQPIVVVNSDPKIGQSCLICVQNWPGNISIEQFNQQQQAVYDKLFKKMDLEHQQFQQQLDRLLKYKERIISSLDKIIQLIIDQRKMVKDSKLKMSSIIQSDSNKKQMIKDIQEADHKQQLINKDVKDQVGNQLKSFEFKFAEIHQLTKILQNNQIIMMQNEENFLPNMEVKIQEVQKDKGKQLKQPYYDLVEESAKKLERYFYLFAFNRDNTLLLVQCDKEIIIQEFMNGKIVKELYKLIYLTKGISCVYFMKKSNKFVTGSDDSAIIIWIHDLDKKWVAQQVLEEHTLRVCCILMNNIEDQLISGSYDCTLKFWRSNSARWKFWNTGDWACKQSIETKYIVRSMIVIKVLENPVFKEWSIVQTLDFDGWGWKLGLTIRDQFVFATDNSDLLEIYDFEKNEQQYKKVSQLQIQKINNCNALFPCQYIASLNILTFKHGEYLNIIKVNENYKYELIQAIQFSSDNICGRMSDDGQYIATQNRSSKEIQIRRMICLE